MLQMLRFCRVQESLMVPVNMFHCGPKSMHACMHMRWDGMNEKLMLEMLRHQPQLVANDMKMVAFPPWCLCSSGQFVDVSARLLALAVLVWVLFTAAFAFFFQTSVCAPLLLQWVFSQSGLTDGYPPRTPSVTQLNEPFNWTVVFSRASQGAFTPAHPS